MPTLQELHAALSAKVKAKNAKGGGLLDFFKGPRSQFNNTSRRTLEKYGDYQIVAAIIEKVPVEKAVTTLLNIVSLGKFNRAKKEAGYDKFYHLGLQLTLYKQGAAPVHVLCEKVEQVSLKEGTLAKRSGYQQLALQNLGSVRRMPFRQFIERALQAAGAKRFFLYDPWTQNCQIFILDLLQANGLGNYPGARQFVYQPIDEMVKRLPGYVQKFAKGATDLGARAAQAVGKGEPSGGALAVLGGANYGGEYREKYERLKELVRHYEQRGVRPSEEAYEDFGEWFPRNAYQLLSMEEKGFMRRAYGILNDGVKDPTLRQLWNQLADKAKRAAELPRDPPRRAAAEGRIGGAKMNDAAKTYEKLIKLQNEKIQNASGAGHPKVTQYKKQKAVKGGGNVEMVKGGHVEEFVVEDAIEKLPSQDIHKKHLDKMLDEILAEMDPTKEDVMKQKGGAPAVLGGKPAVLGGKPSVLGGKQAVLGGKKKKSAPKKKKSDGSGKSKMARRGALIKKLMKERGLTMPQASKAIKAENLSY